MKFLSKLIPLIPISCAILASTLLFSCKQNSSKEASHDSGSPSHSETSSGEIESHTPANCPTGESCFICDPGKREANRLWCKEHNRYENRCWLCHPELEDKTRLYCSEHGIYEDECVICHPESAGKKNAAPSPSTRASETNKNDVLMCNEHGVPEHECAICQPDLASGLKPGEALKIKLTSENSAQKVGIKTETPTSGSVLNSVNAYCVVDYNQDQVTQVTPLIEGVVREIKITFGQKVKKGDVLAILHSPELAEQKADYLAAIAKEKVARLNYERQQRPSVKKVSSANKLESAEANWSVAHVECAAAHQKLLNLDLTEEDITILEASQKPTASLPLRAPFDGTIVTREASVGKLATPGTKLFTLADLHSMWLELSIPASDAAKIKLGMPVDASFDGVPGKTFTGELIWIDSEINPKTRRAKARAVIDLPPSSLRKGLFGQAQIHLNEERKTLTVPSSAIQHINDVSFVFVKKDATLFAATRVKVANGSPGPSLAGILEGLNANDQIVVAGSYIMRSEFLKSQLGAGCVDD